MKSREKLKNNEQNSANASATQGLIPSLQELAENALLNELGTSLIGFIKEDEAANAQVEVIEYPGKVRYPGIALFKQRLENKLMLVNSIVLAVVQGDLPKTETQIQQNPILSSLKGEAIDYSGRTIHHVTPFQAALCAWDNEMCEMLAKYMDTEEVVRQYNEIFPQGIEVQRASQKPFDFSVVVDVISQSSEGDVQAALSKEQNDSLLCQTLNQFRIDFTNCSSQEKIFNPQHLLQAYKVYDENFDRWNQNQRNLFWRQIIGYVQRFLPANIAQDVAQGIYYRVYENEKSRRSFNYKSGSGAIYPVVFDSCSGLGFDYAVMGRGVAWSGRNAVVRGAPTGVYKTYVDQKQRAFNTLLTARVIFSRALRSVRS